MTRGCEWWANCLLALILLSSLVESSIVSCPLNARRYEEKERILAIENYPFGNVDSGTFEGILTAVPRLESVIMRNTSVGKIADGTFHSLDKLKCLDLSNNDLCSLTNSTFSGLSSLETLILAHNHIESLPEGLFESLPNLLLLDLGHNRLSNLQSRVFSGLHKLEELHLQFNNISDISGGAFLHLKNLRRLFLHRNPLTSVDSALDGLGYLNTLVLSYTQLTQLPSIPDSIEILDLEGAQLTTMSQLDSKRLEHLSHLWLARNPWQCDCRLRWFPMWAGQLSSILLDHNAIKCENPSDLYALNISEAMKELNCKDETTTPTSTTSTTLTTTVAISPITTATTTITTTEKETTTSAIPTVLTTTSTSTVSTSTISTIRSSSTVSTTANPTTTSTTIISSTTADITEDLINDSVINITTATQNKTDFSNTTLQIFEENSTTSTTPLSTSVTYISDKNEKTTTSPKLMSYSSLFRILSTSTSTVVTTISSIKPTSLATAEADVSFSPTVELRERPELMGNSSSRFEELVASILQTLSSLRSTETTRPSTQPQLSVHDFVDKKTSEDQTAYQTSVKYGVSTMSSVELLANSGTVEISLDLLPLGVKAALLWVGGGVATSLLLFGLYVLVRKLITKRRQRQMLRLRKFYSPEALQMPSVAEFQTQLTTATQDSFSRYNNASRSGTSSLTGTVHPRTKSAILSYSQSQMDPNPFAADHTVYSRILPTLKESSSQDSFRATTSDHRHV